LKYTTEKEMIDTIHMFDEFSHSPDELTKELRHQKRMSLEPLIYGILQRKYGAFLKKFWDTYSVPVTNNRIVLVERRIHPNLAFVLYNAAYYGRDWGITVICSDVNYEYCKSIVGDKKTVAVIPMFTGIGTPEQGKQEYNQLLQSTVFYSLFGEDHLCLIETDCYFRRKIPDWVLDYDLVGCPYQWNEDMAGGGLSFRNRKAMLQICKTFPEKLEAQDVYLWKGAQELQLRLPPFEKTGEELTESIFSLNPFGVHQWWTFFFPKDLPQAELYFKELLTLQA
jgi:hypothetical protein